MSAFDFIRMPSQLLTSRGLDEMLDGGTILEQDQRGYKVIRLANGDYLKIFRVRHAFSGARIYSYARRFIRNSNRLKRLGVPTLICKQLYHFEDDNSTAVLYSPLAGYPLKKLLEVDLMSLDMAASLGIFIAKLHRLGIHFRSLHMGNIIITPEGDYGLIDVSDMSIYAWPLFCNTRLRNFKHLCRYPNDIVKFGSQAWQRMLEAYVTDSAIGHACASKLQRLSNLVRFDG